MPSVAFALHERRFRLDATRRRAASACDAIRRWSRPRRRRRPPPPAAVRPVLATERVRRRRARRRCRCRRDHRRARRPSKPHPGPPSSRRKGVLIAAVVTVFAVGGAATFAATQLAGSNAGGAATAQEVGEQVLDAIENEDVLGILDLLMPGEREVFKQPAIDFVSELSRLEVLSPAADLAKIDGDRFRDHGRRGAGRRNERHRHHEPRADRRDHRRGQRRCVADRRSAPRRRSRRRRRVRARRQHQHRARHPAHGRRGRRPVVPQRVLHRRRAGQVERRPAAGHPRERDRAVGWRTAGGRARRDVRRPREARSHRRDRGPQPWRGSRPAEVRATLRRRRAVDARRGADRARLQVSGVHRHRRRVASPCLDRPAGRRRFGGRYGVRPRVRRRVCEGRAPRARSSTPATSTNRSPARTSKSSTTCCRRVPCAI